MKTVDLSALLSPFATRLSLKAWRRWTSFFCLYLLLFTVVAGATLPAMPLVDLSSDPQAFSLIQGQEICSHSSDSSGPAQPARDGGLHCVFCLPLMHGGMALPQTVELPRIAALRLPQPMVSVDQNVVPARLSIADSPRAPPVV